MDSPNHAAGTVVQSDAVPRKTFSVVPAQSMPTDCMVTYIQVGEKTVTTINRGWRPGDSGYGGDCKRCTECVARENGRCQITVPIYVSRQDAEDFSPKDAGLVLRRQ